MVDYRIVKHCVICKGKFVVNKSESKVNTCPECQQKQIANRVQN